MPSAVESSRAILGTLRPLVPTMRTLGVLFSGIGCSSAPPSTEPTPPPPPVYSFETIAGAWEGTVREDRTPNVYAMDLTLKPSAAKGEAAGSITYYLAAIGFSSDCTGSLVADAPPASEVYKLKELIGSPCVPNGEVHLVYTQAEGTIAYAWYSQAGVRCCTATLRRRQ